MSLIIQPGFVITDTVSGGGTITGDNPVVGYHTLITASNVSATTGPSSIQSAAPSR